MGNVGSPQISVPLEQCLHQGLVVGLPCSIESKENLNVYFERKKKIMRTTNLKLLSRIKENLIIVFFKFTFR
jgi:hypothetical protein